MEEKINKLVLKNVELLLSPFPVGVQTHAQYFLTNV